MGLYMWNNEKVRGRIYLYVAKREGYICVCIKMGVCLCNNEKVRGQGLVPLDLAE